MAGGQTDAGREPLLDLRDFLGASTASAFERFGRPAVDRWSGGDRWLRFEGPGWSLRARARPLRTGEGARIRSWTFAFEEGFDALVAALHALGLAGGVPDLPEGELRLPLRDSAGRLHSLTASERDGRIHAVSAFDEAPDWESGRR